MRIVCDPRVFTGLLLALTLTAFAAVPASAQQATSEDDMPAREVNINTADASALALALDGVGEVKAAEIVRDREANGPFADAEALQRVDGIGPATLEDNRERIIVETQ